MIIDVSGVELTPDNNGDNCLGNGEYCDENGEQIICCDECAYQLCCNGEADCENCEDEYCPRQNAIKNKG